MIHRADTSDSNLFSLHSISNESLNKTLLNQHNSLAPGRTQNQKTAVAYIW